MSLRQRFNKAKSQNKFLKHDLKSVLEDVAFEQSG